MGFLSKAARGEDLGDSESTSLEEQYEKLFPKIGRDFVSRQDFRNIMIKVLALVDPLGLSGVDLNDDVEARTLALRYRELLDSGRDGSELFEDLIDLEDEDA